MSLILEALRKSEAERRRGQAPGLHAELPPAAPVGRRVVPRAAWFAVVALSTVALVAWIASRPAGPDTAGPVATVPTATAPAPPEAPDAGVAAYPAVDRIPLPAATREAATPTAPADDPDAPPAAVRAAEVAATPAPTAVPPPLPAPVAPPRLATPTARAEIQPGTGTRLPTVGELPAAERSQLPELKLTMHMWNERPAQRFVILDGVRHGEGERVGAATIRAIDAEGVVLELNGRAVRLPLR